MDLNNFKEKLLNLKPDFKVLLSEGYSEERAFGILNNEYVLKLKDVQKQNDSDLLNFLVNYDLEFFRIRNIFFADILRYAEGYLIIGNFDSGYLGLDEKTGRIYIIYADEMNNIHTLFVENEFQFFDVLLVISEYSSRVSEGKIDPFDEEIIEEYIERCYGICQVGNYDSFF